MIRIPISLPLPVLGLHPQPEPLESNEPDKFDEPPCLRAGEFFSFLVIHQECRLKPALWEVQKARELLVWAGEMLAEITTGKDPQEAEKIQHCKREM